MSGPRLADLLRAPEAAADLAPAAWNGVCVMTSK